MGFLWQKLKISEGLRKNIVMILLEVAIDANMEDLSTLCVCVCVLGLAVV